MNVYKVLFIQIQRSKRQLVSMCSKPSPTLDQAIHSIMVVLILNLILGLPHMIYHLLPNTSLEEDVLFHTLFSCHFFIDPIIVKWKQNSYRQQREEEVG